jgi:hypothetical protein
MLSTAQQLTAGADDSAPSSQLHLPLLIDTPTVGDGELLCRQYSYIPSVATAKFRFNP